MKQLTGTCILFLAATQTAHCLPPPDEFNDLSIFNASTPKYLVSDCGDRTAQVHHALTLALASLPPAVAEAQNLGTRSTHGFTAFFKKQSYAPFVASYLHDMQRLKPLSGRWPNPIVPTVPEFVCVKYDTYDRYKHLSFDPYMKCKQPGYYGFTSKRARYIFLCDIFFERPVAPTAPATETCVRVQDNSFQGFGNLLCLYQKYMLVHEMMHFYLGTQGLGFHTKPQEKYSLNDAVRLDAGLSLRNPQNFQAFVAMVDQGCTEAPDPFKSPFGYGAAGGNGTWNVTENLSQDRGIVDSINQLGVDSKPNHSNDLDIA